MAFKARRIDYFYTMVRDQPGEAQQLLARLAGHDVNLLAFASVRMGPAQTQLTLFPDDLGRLVTAAEKDGLVLDGPHPALLVQGDDELGALATVHGKLADVSVNVFASTGLADARGSFGYILYVRPEKFEQAAGALGI
jgi:hypothetical protein